MVKAQQQDQQSRAGANHKGIEKNTEGLDYPLSRRVIDFRYDRHAWRTFQSRLIGKHPALDAHDDGTAGQTCKCLVQAKGTFENGHQHAWHMVKLKHDHIDGHTDVRQRLDRHQQVRNRGDVFDASHEHQTEQYGNRNAGVRRRETERIVK
ncbi:hypothetical protein D3C85_1513160 [compost metagenome]